MPLNVCFDTKNDIEIINKKNFSFANNFINFISLDIENILNDKIISSLSVDNCKEIISKITTVSKNTIIPEIIDTHIFMHISIQTINIQQIKKDLTEVLKVYNKFKKLTEFCYFNDKLKNMTPLQRYIYYLHTSNIEEVILPKQTIRSFGINNNKQYSKHLKNDDILVILKEFSPSLYYSYKCLNINDYMIITFLKLIENNYTILKCKNCSKYFIAFNKANKLYCNRKSPQNASKTCMQYGKEKTWLKRTKDENDWYSLYRKLYQSLQAKAKRNPNNVQFKENYNNFRTDANKWKKAVKERTKTEEEFMNWLQDFRK